MIAAKARPPKSSAIGGPSDRLVASPWRGAVAIVALTVLFYLPAFGAGYVWDDPDHVTQVSLQRTVSALKWVWFRPGATPQYYPLTHTTFWLEWRIYGTNPLGYHAVNVILHAANALLLWRLLVRLGVRGAWLAAALFAWHPVHVESVAWVTERKNTLSAFFYLLAFLAAVKIGRLDQDQHPADERVKSADAKFPWFAYGVCLICFIAAVLSKTVTCTLPAALVLVIWWKHGRLSDRDWLWLSPLFAIALAVAKLTSGMEQWNVGATGPDFAFSFADRVLIAGRALWFYAGKLIWPIPLAFIYPRWTINPHAAWQWIFPVAVIVLIAALALLHKRIGRGPLASVLFFVGTLFPALGFVNVYPMRFSFVADHFQYLASIGLIVLAANGLSKIPWHGQARLASLSLLLGAFGLLTFNQSRAYRDEPTLWLDTLKKNPDCWLAMDNLGSEADARELCRGDRLVHPFIGGASKTNRRAPEHRPRVGPRGPFRCRQP